MRPRLMMRHKIIEYLQFWVIQSILLGSTSPYSFAQSSDKIQFYGVAPQYLQCSVPPGE